MTTRTTASVTSRRCTRALQGGSDGYEIEKRLLHKNAASSTARRGCENALRGLDGRIDHFLHTVDDIT